MTENRRPGVRKRIADALESVDPDLLTRFVQDALVAEKTVWGTCDGCRKRFPVEVPDWNARANVADKLLTQGYGRPRSEEEESGKGFVLHRSLVFPTADPEQILSLLEEHGVGALRAHLAGGLEVVTHDQTEAATQQPHPIRPPNPPALDGQPSRSGDGERPL